MERKTGPIGDANYIQKKVPKFNNKYANVQSKLTGQTGKTAKDVNIISKWEETNTICKPIIILGDQLVAKRKTEKYKRIKCSTLAKMMQEINYEESIYNLNDNMGAPDQMSYQGGGMEGPVEPGESLAGLLNSGNNNVPNSDTKSQMSSQSQATTVSAVTYATEALGITD